MWNLVLYILAVIVGLVLFFFYDNEEEANKTTTTTTNQTTSTPSIDRNRKSDPRREEESFCLSSLFAVLGLKLPGEGNEDQQFESFTERFSSFEEISKACSKAGLESCSLIIGVDFTASNEWKGRKSFNQNCLHKLIGTKVNNPYQKVIWILGQTLAPFDDDNLIPAFGFGDSDTKDTDVFPFKYDGSPCDGFQEVLEWYNEVVRRIALSGPTSFAPVIKRAVEIVRDSNKYHILIIISDGQVTETPATVEAIVEASQYPLSIITVGVGDGPWQIIEEFDSHLPKRKFDNFRFVDYHKATVKSKSPDMAFALQALMEIPDQYKRIQELGYLKKTSSNRSQSSVPDCGSMAEGGIGTPSSSPSSSPIKSSILRSPQESPKGSPVRRSPWKSHLKHRLSNMSC